MKQYDSIIIGTGQAGPSLAGALTKKGEKVAVAEGYKIGGSCVNYGCIPTKTLIASARVARMAQRGDEYGVITGDIQIDWDKVMARTHRRLNDARGGLENWLMGMKNLDIYPVYASFEGTRDGLHRVRMGDEVIAAPQVFLNTGTRPSVPQIQGLDTVEYLDSEGVLHLKERPEHLIALGGGYISLEMGHAFRRFGSKVTIIEGNETIIHNEDDDIIAEVERILGDEDVQIVAGRRTVEVSKDANGQITVTLEDRDGSRSTVTGTHVLVSVGRKPNVEKLNLEAVGVTLNERGYIGTDEHLQTNVPGIWAMGDVNGRGAFTHTSYQDYEIVLDHLNRGSRKVTDRIMAYALYTDPPLGRVGMSEKEARKSGRNVLMAVKPMSHIGRALEQGETYGLIKLLVDADTEQFLGAAVLGFHGDDVIQIVSYFMYTGASYKVMQNALPIHPTVGEFLPTILGELKPLK